MEQGAGFVEEVHSGSAFDVEDDADVFGVVPVRFLVVGFGQARSAGDVFIQHGPPKGL
uniref:hypothetical protein n=1 Tax=Paenarthrobacter nicotinovorans TaxID=29320 RepID=UPI0015F2F845|nr:hypothetical protein [Paenarthrobacter nicotinovorans]